MFTLVQIAAIIGLLLSFGVTQDQALSIESILIAASTPTPIQIIINPVSTSTPVINPTPIPNQSGSTPLGTQITPTPTPSPTVIVKEVVLGPNASEYDILNYTNNPLEYHSATISIWGSNNPTTLLLFQGTGYSPISNPLIVDGIGLTEQNALTVTVPIAFIMQQAISGEDKLNGYSMKHIRVEVVNEQGLQYFMKLVSFQ